MRLPLSLVATDIFGQDMLASGLIAESGDQDGEARPAHAGPQAMPWVDDSSRQLQLSLYGDDDEPFECDPRHVLARVVDAVIALRRVARGFPRNRGWDASFMPKPLGDHEGSGIHVHMTLLDERGG